VRDDDKPMRLTIRTALPADADVLRALHRRSSFVWPEDRPHLEAHPELFGVDPVALAAGQTRLALAGSEIVGFHTLVPAPGTDLELEDLFVEPCVMRRGVGRALIEDAVRRGRGGGRERILVVAAPRTRAFYEDVGFAVIGDATTRFGPALRLERRLDDVPIRGR
jgi:GNAT superfamily N-acetyltransferase